jgi:hypothetical protein
MKSVVNQFRIERETRMESVRIERVLGSHILSDCNWLWLRETVKEGVNESNNPIQNPVSISHAAIVHTGFGVHPTSYPTGTGDFLGVKRQGHEADHSPPTSAEVKKIWFYTSTPTYVLMA